MSKVALVTGASSGIGAATARRLTRAGYTVYGAARRTDRLAELASDGVRALELDLTEESSIEAAAQALLAEAGRIDVLVNNAGYGSYGALEDVPLSEARRQFEVNVFGLARLTQLLLPTMRAQGSGRIVNVTSMGGRLTMPLGGWYHATKYAVEAYSDALRLEVRPFGIDVIIVEPGSIATEWGGIAAENAATFSGQGPYASRAQALQRAMSSPRMANVGSSPELIADVIAKGVAAKRPRVRYVAGALARPLLTLKAVLPDRAFDALLARVL
ncbi:oxidoreductase [Serinibacter salmoneus]|uniref:Short-subunit dehydrogenase n=1 Tax=Serinibacter salmoneus TaxID=556530 RepID=A0A2A9D4B7_9MICO|nr:oxidoreductase [Serinibacter salmoneus]PFG21231.1 short-subunit dehydrogenase [Serinibacter salmoneus]